MRLRTVTGTFQFSALALCALLTSVAGSAQQSSDFLVAEDLNRLGELEASHWPAVEGAVIVDSVHLDGSDAPPAALELERFEVWAPGAEVTVHTRSGTVRRPAPEVLALRGTIAGELSSRVVVTVSPGGRVRGLAAWGGRYWMIENGFEEISASAHVHEIDPQAQLANGSHEFSCGATALDRSTEFSELFGRDPFFPGRAVADARPQRTQSRGGVTNTARIAVETDWEFYQLFGDLTAATDYVTDVFAYVSTVYESEVATDLQVSSLQLWATSADPWDQQGPSCGLMEFGKFWNDNNSAIERTAAHFLSGKNNGGGVAWVGALCADPDTVNLNDVGLNCAGLANVDTYYGDYGYSGDIDGNFDPMNPSVLWDVVVVAHELGHNFNSPHTHCYEGIGGNGNPVDECFNGEAGLPGCYSGMAVSLPGPGCSGPGGGCGTLMSYCHLLGGGIGNISMTFGQGHPQGIEPERVPNRMREYVDAIDIVDPSCLALTTVDEIFVDGFESGDTSSWSSTTP